MFLFSFLSSCFNGNLMCDVTNCNKGDFLRFYKSRICWPNTLPTILAQVSCCSRQVANCFFCFFWWVRKYSWNIIAWAAAAPIIYVLFATRPYRRKYKLGKLIAQQWCCASCRAMLRLFFSWAVTMLSSISYLDFQCFAKLGSWC